MCHTAKFHFIEKIEHCSQPLNNKGNGEIFGTRAKQMTVISAIDQLDNGNVRATWKCLANEVIRIWKIRTHFSFAEKLRSVLLSLRDTRVEFGGHREFCPQSLSEALGKEH